MSHTCLIIFDMDDTLVATGKIWRRAEERLFALLGHPFQPEVARTYKGMNAPDVGRAIHAALQPFAHTAEECARLMRDFLLKEFTGSLAPMPGADDVLRRLSGHFILAVASGSPPEAIEGAMQRLGWRHYFSALVSSEEVPHGKPAPDVFLETARRCNIPPAETLVIEDSLHGVRAAKAAGMRCFAVPSSDDPTIRREADRSFASLSEITITDIES